MEFLSFVIFLILATALGLVLMFISNILGQKKKTVRKNDIYESGVNPVGSATRQYDIKFFLTAILFLLFDVEIVFMFPWAINVVELGYLGLFKMFMFMGLLFAGLIYLYKKKALLWD